MKSLNKFAILGAFLIAISPALADDTHHQSSDSGDTTVVINGPSNMMANGMMASMMSNTGMSMMPMLAMMNPKHIEGRLAFLKTELKITDAQQPLWNAFADAMRRAAHDAASPMPGMSNNMMPSTASGPVTLLSRIERREQMLGQALDHLKAMDAAIKPLYATFGDEQKRSADELLMPEFMSHM